MEAIRAQVVLTQDGVVSVGGLPFKRGQQVELLVIGRRPPGPKRKRLTARRLLASGLAGMWRKRKDMVDSAACARRLRDRAQRRSVR